MYQNSTQPAKRKERKVSVVLRRTDGPEHCSGVESIALDPEGSTLYTASRDSCVRRWGIPAPGSGAREPLCRGSLEGHTDWVNDVVVANDRVLTCSNDRTVRVWKGDTGQPISTLTHHSDYVTSLAVARGQPLAASGGLRGELFLIDASTLQYVKLRPPSTLVAPSPSASPSQAAAVDDAQPSTSSQNKASIYAVALNTSGSVVACGSCDQMIRLWDTRSGEKIGKLRGHTENVRSLLLHPDGSVLLSGAADGTIKLWDLCMQRCVQTYNMHSDSVWALQATNDWSMIYSGGRDRCVYRMQLSTRTAELLAVEDAPVRKLALDQNSNTMWVASNSPSAHQWQLPSKPPIPSANPNSRTFPANRRRMSFAPNARAKHMSQETQQDKSSAALQEPSCSTPGLPPINDFRVLNDRRHILAKTSDGNVALWDVLTGTPIQSFGMVNLDAQEKALFEPRSVPAWFACDVKLGQLTITLEPPGCFSAEEYAQSLGHAGVPDDQKLNLGKLVLERAFVHWRNSMVSGSSGSPQGDPMAVDAAAQGVDGVQGPGLHYPHMHTSSRHGVQPAVMSQTYIGLPWRLLANHLSAAVPEPDVVPAWVGDVLLRNANVASKEKAAFILQPAEGSNLPCMTQSRLNAPRILQVHKVSDYCVNKLKEMGFTVAFRPVYLQYWSGSQQPPLLPQPMPGSQGGPYYLELTCNGLAVPYDMSLASVKKYIWKRSDDPIFVYRVLNPKAPAPLPVLGPPS